MKKILILFLCFTSFIFNSFAQMPSPEVMKVFMQVEQIKTIKTQASADKLDSLKGLYKQTDSAYLFCIIELADLNSYLGNFTAALFNFEEIIEILPGADSIIPGRLSSAYMRMGKFNKAQFYADKMIEYYDIKFGYSKKALIYLYMDSFSKCLTYADSALGANSDVQFSLNSFIQNIHLFKATSYYNLDITDSAKRYAYILLDSGESLSAQEVHSVTLILKGELTNKQLCNFLLKNEDILEVPKKIDRNTFYYKFLAQKNAEIEIMRQRVCE